jgi:hypothetical protein
MNSRRPSPASVAEIMLGHARRMMRYGFKILPLRPAERGVAKSQSAAYVSRGYDATDDFNVFRQGGDGKRPAPAGAAP